MNTDLTIFSLEDVSHQLAERPTKHPRSIIQLFRPGEFNHPTYGKLIFDMDMFRKIKYNFDHNVRGQKLSIDYDHNGEKHAAGWIQDIQISPEGVFALVEWTPKGAEAIRNKEYLYISPDYKPVWTDPETGLKYEFVLFGAALTNRPFIKRMQEVKLSEDVIKSFLTDKLGYEPNKANELAEQFIQEIGGEEMDKEQLTKAFTDFIQEHKEDNTKEVSEDMNNDMEKDVNLNDEFVDTDEPGVYLDENENVYMLSEDGTEWDLVGFTQDNAGVFLSEDAPGVAFVYNPDTDEAVLLHETERATGEPEIDIYELDVNGDVMNATSIALSEEGYFIATPQIYEDDEPSLLFYDGENTYDLTTTTAILLSEGVDPTEVSLSELLDSSIQLAEVLENSYNTEEPYDESNVELSEPQNNETYNYIARLEQEIADLRAELEQQKAHIQLDEESHKLAEIEALVDNWVKPDSEGKVKITPAERDATIKLMVDMTDRQRAEFINLIEKKPGIKLDEYGSNYYNTDENAVKLSELDNLAKHYQKTEGLDESTAYLKAAVELDEKYGGE